MFNVILPKVFNQNNYTGEPKINKKVKYSKDIIENDEIQEEIESLKNKIYDIRLKMARKEDNKIKDLQKERIDKLEKELKELKTQNKRYTKVKCDKCGREVQTYRLPSHYKTNLCMKNRPSD
jgi:hypothetical protein